MSATFPSFHPESARSHDRLESEMNLVRISHQPLGGLLLVILREFNSERTKIERFGDMLRLW